ncbi:MAG: 3-hydroxyacyl-ACP dehydratase FabZ [Bdellovibrionota bacterium]
MGPDISLPLKTEDICKIIPHRYPFLLIDRVTHFVDREWIQGYKNISANENFFAGHFPDRPIMPGVLMLEALAQVGAIFAHLSTGGVAKGGLVVFSGAESVRFRRPVVPGDCLTLKMELLKSKFGHWKMQGTASVGDEMAVEGILMATEVR